MVGGIVIEVIKLRGRVWVNCVERDKLDTGKHNQCAIYVERNENSESIKLKDSLWWQGRYAMWTPHEVSKKLRPACDCREHLDCNNKEKSGIDYDIKIPRVGYSGVERPAV